MPTFYQQSTSSMTDDACDGFDRFAGRTWIYPNNMPIRTYQQTAVTKGLFKNTLVVLPTGFGKTFIAAVIMYNFYRWYPEGKIIFVAPTRPLVAQQIAECKKISGIPSSDCVELTGHIGCEKRRGLWKTKRVIFATPQVIENDLDSGVLPAKKVKCLVIDEAHKAQGQYAYVGIARKLQETNLNGFRLVGLTATPGSDLARVQQLISNLYINEMIFKRESDIDLMAYKKNKSSKAFTVPLKGEHKRFVEIFVKATDRVFKELFRAGLTYSANSIERCSKFVLIKGMERLNHHDYNSHGTTRGKLGYYLRAGIALVHLFELLTIYGIRVFYASISRTLSGNGNNIRSLLASSVEFGDMLDEIKCMFSDAPNIDINYRARCDLLKGHPKLMAAKEILFKHFEEHGESSKVMLFTKYRDSVYDIVQAFKQFDPTIRPCAFVGQGSGAKKTSMKSKQRQQQDGDDSLIGGTTSGMSQKEQLQAINDFKAGKFNLLVATCVAEEGLDIGEVDLILCYDTSSSAISNVQRRGRTGRKRAGDIQTLVTQDYEEKKLQKAGTNRRTAEDQLLNRESYSANYYRKAPRMIPPDIEPKCIEHKVYPVDDEPAEEPKKRAKPRRKRAKVESPESSSSSSSCKKKKKKMLADEQATDTDEVGESGADTDVGEQTFVDDLSDSFVVDNNDTFAATATAAAATAATTTNDDDEDAFSDDDDILLSFIIDKPKDDSSKVACKIEEEDNDEKKTTADDFSDSFSSSL